MYGNIGKGIGTWLIIGFISLFVLIGLGLYFGGRALFYHKKPLVIESKKLIIPEIRLHTDGKVIDTVYIYKKS